MRQITAEVSLRGVALLDRYATEREIPRAHLAGGIIEAGLEAARAITEGESATPVGELLDTLAEIAGGSAEVRAPWRWLARLACPPIRVTLRSDPSLPTRAEIEADARGDRRAALVSRLATHLEIAERALRDLDHPHAARTIAMVAELALLGERMRIGRIVAMVEGALDQARKAARGGEL